MCEIGWQLREWLEWLVSHDGRLYRCTKNGRIESDSDLAGTVPTRCSDAIITVGDLRKIVGELDEAVKLRAVISQHNLCHDLHGKVDARGFADGCAAEQRELYGHAPDADEVERLNHNARIALGDEQHPDPVFGLVTSYVGLQGEVERLKMDLEGERKARELLEVEVKELQKRLK